jgi:creatinine amidohydrolase
MEAELLILPSLSITCSEHHMDFAGTLTLQHETFLQQMIQVLEAVYQHGFRRLLVLNSHGGNQGIGQVLVEHFGHRHPDCRIVFATWWKLALEELKKLNESGFGGAGHAGEFETSLILLIAPDLVRTEKLEKGANTSTWSWAEGDMLQGPQASFYRSMKTMTPNGVFGDPTFASEDKGRRISSLVVPRLMTLIRDLH